MQDYFCTHLYGFDTWPECIEKYEHTKDLYVRCMAAVGGCGGDEAAMEALRAGRTPAGWSPRVAEFTLEVSGWRARSRGIHTCPEPLRADPTELGFAEFKRKLIQACRAAFKNSFWGDIDFRVFDPNGDTFHTELWAEVGVNCPAKPYHFRRFVARGGRPLPRKSGSPGAARSRRR